MPRLPSTRLEDHLYGASSRRLAVACGALIALTAVGTIGFALVEGLSFVDSLYMTVITLSTVGFSEVAPASEAGRWFTICFIAVGVGTAFYAFVALAEFVIEGRLRNVLGRRSMKRTIDSLRNHVVVCGFGRLGQVVAERLTQSSTPFVIIDRDPTLQAECDASGYLFVLGSALDDDVLAAAGIDRARALVVATNSDSDNTFVALLAREANPKIDIHARAETPAGIRRLRLAGASQVISPHQVGGQRIANAIVRPAVVEFLELSAPGSGAAIDLEEVALSEGSRVASVALRELPGRGIHVSVVAIKRGDEPIRLRPGPDEVLEAGDRVIVVGDRDNLALMAALAVTPPRQA
ncbi:MAG: potassium channel protein [Myxococcales bacterium]|nr:potassium channel protein [Myxococcales bacterium]